MKGKEEQREREMWKGIPVKRNPRGSWIEHFQCLLKKKKGHELNISGQERGTRYEVLR